MNDAINGGTDDRRSHAIRRSERGVEAFVSAKRHSRRVRVLKFALPAAALFVSAVFLGYSLLIPSAVQGTVDLGSASIEGGNLVMANPTLDGFTKENLPYTMTAARARQAIGTAAGAIQLEEIRATVPIDKENQAIISAGGGTFDRQNDRLTLDGAVTLRTTSGLVARLQSAEVDIASNDLSTDQPVEIEMEGMRIQADTFRASEGGKTLVFEDRVRVEVDPAHMRKAQEQIPGSGGDE